MVPPERDHHRDVIDLHHRAKLLRPHRAARAVPPQEGHEVDAGQDHGFEPAKVSACMDSFRVIHSQKTNNVDCFLPMLLQGIYRIYHKLKRQ